MCSMLLRCSFDAWCHALSAGTMVSAWSLKHVHSLTLASFAPLITADHLLLRFPFASLTMCVSPGCADPVLSLAPPTGDGWDIGINAPVRRNQRPCPPGPEARVDQPAHLQQQSPVLRRTAGQQLVPNLQQRMLRVWVCGNERLGPDLRRGDTGRWCRARRSRRLVGQPRRSESEPCRLADKAERARHRVVGQW